MCVLHTTPYCSKYPSRSWRDDYEAVRSTVGLRTVRPTEMIHDMTCHTYKHRHKAASWISISIFISKAKPKPKLRRLI